jgi:hypothetical protein
MYGVQEKMDCTLYKFRLVHSVFMRSARNPIRYISNAGGWIGIFPLSIYTVIFRPIRQAGPVSLQPYKFGFSFRNRGWDINSFWEIGGQYYSSNSCEEWLSCTLPFKICKVYNSIDSIITNFRIAYASPLGSRGRTSNNGWTMPAKFLGKIPNHTCARNYRPSFRKTSTKRSYSMTEYERFGLIFTKTRVYKFGHRSGLKGLPL